MRRTHFAFVLLVLCCSPALADTPDPTPSRSKEPAFSVGLGGGYFRLNATQSAKAVLGSPGGVTFGGELRYLVKKGSFVSAGARHFSKDGQRVFVAAPGDPVFPLGFPLKLSLTSIDVLAGYRFPGLRFKSGARFVPYLGAGLELVSYKERSEIAGLAEESNETKPGGQFLGGLEYAHRPWALAVEAGYSTVANAIGVGGVSAVYGESNIGGFRVLGRFRFGF